MALIDLTRQAKASTTAGQVAKTTNVTSSVTGLYDVEWGSLTTANLGTGSLDTGTSGDVQTRNMYMYDESTGGNLYTTGSYGSKLIMTLNPSGYMTGSVTIYGDLVV